MIYFIKFIFALILVCFASIGNAANSNVKTTIGIGYFHSEGEYKNSDTLTLNSLPVFIRLQNGLTSFKVSSILSRYERTGRATSKKIDQEGLGNSYVSVKQLFKAPVLIHYLDVEGKIKTPTADTTDGLGTAGYDFKLSTTAYYKISKNWLTASIAYQWRDNELRSTFSTALGLSHTFSKMFSGGVILDYEEATQNISDDTLESVIHVTWKAHKKTKYSFYMIKGFKDLKLDWASGLQASYHW